MKLLITGANGFLGQKLTKIASKEFKIEPIDIEELDFTDRKKTIEYIKNSKPDVVIHVAAMTNVDECEIEKEKAHKINVLGTGNIVDACKKINAKIVYTSTDFVFDGKKGNYKEEDETNPVSYYGSTKLEGENIVKNSGLKYIIARLCMLYGYNSENDKTTFVKWVINNLSQKREINVITDQIGSPTLIDDIANALIELIKQNKKGIYHITGPEKASVYEFAQKINKIFKFNGKINKVTTEFLNQKAKRPPISNLDISKLRSCNIKMNDLGPGLNIMKTQM